MHCVRGCLPQPWADPNPVSETIITAYHKAALAGKENQYNHTHHINTRNLSCGDEHDAGYKDKHISCQFPTSSHQHRLDHQSNHNLLQGPINQLKFIMALVITYKDKLNNKINRIRPAHVAGEELRIDYGLCVCNRHVRNAVCCFSCGQQGKDDNTRIIEPLRGNLCLKVIRYLSINNPW